MKTEYVELEIEIITFTAEDVITASVGEGEEDD